MRGGGKLTFIETTDYQFTLKSCLDINCSKIEGPTFQCADHTYGRRDDMRGDGFKWFQDLKHFYRVALSSSLSSASFSLQFKVLLFYVLLILVIFAPVKYN